MALRAFITNNFSVKVVSIALASLLWLFAKGEQTSTREVTIPLLVRSVPPGLTTVRRVPETMEVMLSGPNKELVKAGLWVHPHAVVDLGQAREDRDLRVSLSPANVVVSSDADVKVIEVIWPKALDLEIDQKAQKRVQVIPAVSGELPDGFFLFGRARAVPESVSIFGPKRVLEEMISMETAPLDVTGRRDGTEASRAIDVSGDWNLYAVPKEVRVTVAIEGTRLATIRGVPVVFQHEPSFRSASIDASVAEIEISGPEHAVLAAGRDDIRVVVDSRGLPRGFHQLVPDVSVPEGLTFVSVSPQRFTATLE